MIDVENVPGELLLLMGSRLCVGGGNIPTVGAGFFPQAMLRNPGESGVIITLLEIRAGSGVALRYVWGPTLNTLANGHNSAFTDTRVFGQGTVGQVLSESLLVAGPNFGNGRAGPGRDIVLKIPRGLGVLMPGSAYSVSSSLDNVSFSFSFTWLERVAQASELNL